MSVGFTDWVELGIFPLQDHERDVPAEIRQQIVGGRIVRRPDPDVSPDGSTFVEFGLEDDMGTLGDLHPWFFWQTRDRDERGTGSWAQAFATIAVEGQAKPTRPTMGTSTKPIGEEAPTGLLPIRSGLVNADGRMKTKYPGWPKCFSRVPHGTLMIAMPGMNETAQHEVMLHADPRLMAVNAYGPPDVGTLVCDLQPDMEPCMDGRAARLHSMMRVIPFGQEGPQSVGAAPGNAIAWNLSTSKQDGLAGFGLCWARLTAGSQGPGQPTTPRETSKPGQPITPWGNTRGPHPTTGPGTGTASTGAGGGGGGAGGVAFAVSSEGGRHEHDGDTPCDFGKFGPTKQAAHGLAFMAQDPTSGPFTAGSEGDKHQIGTDADGHELNAGHISTSAYFHEGLDRDGPFFFEGPYIDPEPLPLRSRVHLTWDGGKPHSFVGGTRSGVWRWYAEYNVVVPKEKVPTVTPGQTPTRPTTPSGGTPGTPSTPGPPAPGAPAPFIPPTVTTPGPAAPGAPAPTPPTTTRGGATQTPRTGAGIPPTPPKVRVKTGGIAPPGGGGSGKPGGGVGGGGRVSIDPWTGKPWVSPGSKGGGSTGVGGQGVDPGSQPGGSSGTSEQGLPVDPAGGAQNIGVVGGVSSSDTSLFELFHPMMEGFAGLSFRPGLMVNGVDSFVHNKGFSADAAHLDELTRPQVLTAEAFGAVVGEAHSYNEGERPDQSRARGGIAVGGVLFHPPQFVMEDYFGINSIADVTSPVTDAHVMLAPGVNLSLGVPNAEGTLADLGHSIKTTGVTLDIIERVSSADVSIFTAQVTGGDPFVNLKGTGSVRVPAGSTAQRPGTALDGEIRVNTDDDVVDYRSNGTWFQTGAGGGGHTTFAAHSDTPANYTGAGGKAVMVNATPDALEFIDLDTIYYTEAEVDTFFSNHASSGDHDGRYYTETELDAGQLDNRYYTETESDNTFMPLAGGQFTGNIGVKVAPSANIRFEVEDDGVGGSGPLVKITADDATPYALVIGNDTFSTSDLEGLVFWTGNAGDTHVEALGSGGSMTFQTGAVDRIVIENAGDVGVGIANPVEKLHVNGVVRSDGGFNKGGTLGLTADAGEITFVDDSAQTHTVTIKGGIITAWNIV